jgi:L-malate glycosyltransferase
MIQAIDSHQTTSSQDERPVICHVIHALGVGGAEVLVGQMVRRMSDRYRCVVAVLDEFGEIGRRLQQDGITVACLGRSPGLDMKCARRLGEFSEQNKVDILHAHQYTPFFQAMLSRGLSGQRPVVFTEHGRHYPDLPSAKRTLMNRLLLRKRDRLIACGSAVRTALIRNEGLPENRLEVIYNGVDVNQLSHPSADARERIRKEFGFGDDDFVVIQVARLHELKDHQTAIRTIERLREGRPMPRLLIVGEGEQRVAIEMAINERQLDDHVRLIGTRSDIADLLAASDAFLLTSISEGIPLTVIEAMAAELPVVATRVGGLPEMVQCNRSGYLADAGDDRKLAEALHKLQDDAGLRQSMGEAGLQVARQTFGLARMLSSYESVYEQMLSTRNHSPPVKSTEFQPVSSQSQTRA